MALYTLLALRYPLWPSLANPRATWGLLVEPTWTNLAFHLFLYLGLTVLYLLALRILSAPDVPVWKRLPLLIVGAWLACSLILLAVAPGGESHDIFDYTFRGRMMAEWGANPLADTPKQYKTAPYYRYVAWHSHVDTYGPIWEMASVSVATTVHWTLEAFGQWPVTPFSCPDSRLSCRKLVGYLIGYRLLAIGLTGVCAWLIMDMQRTVLRLAKPQPTRPTAPAGLPTASLGAWLWSPMTLVAGAVGAHNEFIMLALLLGALWLLQRRQWLFGVLAFVLAAHVKLTPLILTPILGLWLVRRCGWPRTIGYGVTALVAGLVLSWLLYAPFDGWGTLPRMLVERSLFLANSPWQALHYWLRFQVGWPYATVWRLTVHMPTLFFLAAALLISFWMLDFRPRRWKITPAPQWDDDRLLWRALAAVTLLYLAIGSFWFQHWYVLWVLAPAVLVPDSRLTCNALPWLSFGALAANVVLDFLLTTMPKDAPRTGLYVLIVVLIWGPVIVAAAMAMRRPHPQPRLAAGREPTTL